MKQIQLYLLFIFLLGIKLPLKAQNGPTLAWDKAFGGTGSDRLISTILTSDGGFLLGGFTNSGISGDKTQASKGNDDFWIVKTDANGNKQWDKTYGGQAEDHLTGMIQTTDGGYLLGGFTSSGISGDVSRGNYGDSNYWILKIDANGTKLWDKTFIGNSSDILYALKSTSDGGFILGGTSSSPAGADKSEPNKGLYYTTDFWIIKLDNLGNKVWDRTIGGRESEDLYDLQQTADGGYLLGGYSGSRVGLDKSQSSFGSVDYWLVKLDGNGTKLWDRTFGGAQADHLNRISETKDGGYILGGFSNSDTTGNKTTANKGSADYWVIKVDGGGNKIWEKSFGGNKGEIITAIEQTPDGGYLLLGASESGVGGDKSEAQIGENDFWIIKIDASGNKIWDKTLGGSNTDSPNFIKQLATGEIVLSGSSDSGKSGTKTSPSKGNYDYWFLKLNAPCTGFTATVIPECMVGGTRLNLAVKAMQSTSGKYSWILNYTENGVAKTLTDSTETSTLAFNPKPGTVFRLVSITSGTCTTILNQTFTMPAFPAAPSANPVKRCGPGTVVFSASGANAGSQYVWYNKPSNGTPLQTDSTGIFKTPKLNEPTLFYVAVINELGCEGPRTQVLAELNYCQPVYIPNIITQNQDGKNDTFQPQNLAAGTWTLQIFNRWGKKIYEKANYQNSWPEGNVKGGTYYYLLQNQATNEKYKGWLEVAE